MGDGADMLHRAEEAIGGTVEALQSIDGLLEPLDAKLAPFREQASALHSEHERCVTALQSIESVLSALSDCSSAETELTSFRRCGDAAGHAERLARLSSSLHFLMPHARSPGVAPSHRTGTTAFEAGLSHALADVSYLTSSLSASSSQLQDVLIALQSANAGMRAARSFGSARFQQLSADLCNARSPESPSYSAHPGAITSSAPHGKWSKLSKDRAQSEGPEDLRSLVSTFATALDSAASRWHDERLAASTAFARCDEECAVEALTTAVDASVKWVCQFCDGMSAVKDAPDRVLALADAEHSLNVRRSLFTEALGDEEPLTAQLLQAETVLSNAILACIAELETEVRKSSKPARGDGMVHPLSSRFTVFFRRFAEHETRLMNDTEVMEQAWWVDKSLYSSLEAKSKVLREKALAELFMMNNAAFLASSGRRSERLVSVMGSEWVDEKESEAYTRGERYVNEAWARAEAACEAAMVELPVSQRDKEAVKKALTRFNQLLDDNCAAQSRWAVPEKHMREWLLQQVKARVYEPYKRLHEHLSKASFSKYPERYLKHRPEQVAGRLESLFSLGSS
jgi:hypothetical protein